jgi:DNA-binding CsgD family transcriptional regulator
VRHHAGSRPAHPALPTDAGAPGTGPASPLALAAAAFCRRHALSGREAAVFVGFVVERRSNKEIARSLGIAYSTVKQYWARICAKTGCPDQVTTVLVLSGELADGSVRADAEATPQGTTGREVEAAKRTMPRAI